MWLLEIYPSFNIECMSMSIMTQENMGTKLLYLMKCELLFENKTSSTLGITTESLQTIDNHINLLLGKVK